MRGITGRRLAHVSEFVNYWQRPGALLCTQPTAIATDASRRGCSPFGPSVGAAKHKLAHDLLRPKVLGVGDNLRSHRNVRCIYHPTDGTTQHLRVIILIHILTRTVFSTTLFTSETPTIRDSNQHAGDNANPG
jgi:hypothetical protein